MRCIMRRTLKSHVSPMGTYVVTRHMDDPWKPHESAMEASWRSRTMLNGTPMGVLHRNTCGSATLNSALPWNFHRVCAGLWLRPRGTYLGHPGDFRGAELPQSSSRMFKGRYSVPY